MKPSRLTEEQIIGILQEHETGAATADGQTRKGCLPAIGSPRLLLLNQINSSALDTKEGRGRQG
jgi:hypothetical protein